MQVFHHGIWSCFVRVQLLCSLLHFLHCLLGAFCLGNLFFDICLRILWSWAMRDVTDDWRLVVECLNDVWWMTFCSLGELCESTFNCNIQMSYFALSGLILILFPAHHFEMWWNTCGDQGKPVNPVEPIAFARTKATRIPCREPMFSPSPEHEGVDRLLQQDQITRQIKEGLQAGTDSTVAQCQLQSPS